MDANERADVSGPMSEVDSEQLPNGDDSAFASEQHSAPATGSPNTPDGPQVDSGEVVTAVPVALSGEVGITSDHVLVATSQGLLTTEQLAQGDSENAINVKTTHIVIHDQSLQDAEREIIAISANDPALRTPTTPLPPPTPATPLSRERGFKYQWDESVYSMILPVRCKSSNGDLFKTRFGSGGRGRCIRMKDHWYTPSEFEAVCGRASSKDWKRSIRYGGRTLQCLIEDGILQPHATSCTCAACCDDESVTGPVRLFQPYKRRKRESGSEIIPMKKKSISGASKSPSHESPTKTSEALVFSLGTGMVQPLKMECAEAANATIQIIPAADSSGNFSGEAVAVMTAPQPQPQTPKSATSLLHQSPGTLSRTGVATAKTTLDQQEQKRWWQLEEMATSLLHQAQQLKELIDQSKQQSIASREAAITLQKQQLEKEKAEAVAAVRIETQLNLSRAVMEERAQKEIAIQNALAHARAEMQEKMDSVTVVSDDKQVFTVTFAAPPQGGQTASMDNLMEADGDESDRDKE